MDDKDKMEPSADSNGEAQSSTPTDHSPEAAQNGQPDSAGMSGGTSDGDDNSG